MCFATRKPLVNKVYCVLTGLMLTPSLCVHVSFLVPSFLIGGCGDLLLILTACVIFCGVTVPVQNRNGPIVLVRRVSSGDIWQLWRMTLWPNWLKWNECCVIHARLCSVVCDCINSAEYKYVHITHSLLESGDTNERLGERACHARLFRRGRY